MGRRWHASCRCRIGRKRSRGLPVLRTRPRRITGNRPLPGILQRGLRSLKGAIAEQITQTNMAYGGDVPAAFERAVRVLMQRREFWRQFTPVPDVHRYRSGRHANGRRREKLFWPLCARSRVRHSIELLYRRQPSPRSQATKTLARLLDKSPARCKNQHADSDRKRASRRRECDYPDCRPREAQNHRSTLPRCDRASLPGIP